MLPERRRVGSRAGLLKSRAAGHGGWGRAHGPRRRGRSVLAVLPGGGRGEGRGGRDGMHTAWGAGLAGAWAQRGPHPETPLERGAGGQGPRRRAVGEARGRGCRTRSRWVQRQNLCAGSGRTPWPSRPREAGPWLCGPLRTPWQCEQPPTGAEPACPGSRENQNACRRQGLEPRCPRRGRSAPPARTPLRDAAGGRQPARGPGPVSGAPGRACRGGSVSGPAHRPVRASKGRRHERGAVRMRCHPAWASTGMPGVCSHLVRALPSAPLRVRMGTGAVGRKQAGLQEHSTLDAHISAPRSCPLWAPGFAA